MSTKSVDEPDNLGHFIPISWLEVGLQCSKAIGKVKRVDHTYGTGFLIPGNLFITNHHVLSTREDAKSAIVQFNYQHDAEGRAYEPVNFELDPDSCFKTSTENDWTLIRIKGEANKDWGAIGLKSVDIGTKGYANIIQHPGGETKQIALYHNIITYVDDTRVQYLTDTLPGSSGSAVFDSQWRLIAIHHSGGWLTEASTRKRVYRNEGINVNCVLRDLASLGLTL